MPHRVMKGEKCFGRLVGLGEDRVAQRVRSSMSYSILRVHSFDEVGFDKFRFDEFGINEFS